jgi:hypothetical protein
VQRTKFTTGLYVSLAGQRRQSHAAGGEVYLYIINYPRLIVQRACSGRAYWRSNSLAANAPGLFLICIDVKMT